MTDHSLQRLVSCFLLCVSGLGALGCSDEDNTVQDPADRVDASDVRSEDATRDASPDALDSGESLDGDTQTDGSGDVSPDADPTAPLETSVGTPSRPPNGTGERPVVFWPKPVYAHPDVPLDFTMVAFDPEHEQLLYDLNGAPDGMTIDAAGTINWESPADGTHDFEVLVDDGRGDPERVPVSLTVDPEKFIFVAPDGTDGPGTIDEPLGNLEAAQRRLAQMDGGVVYVREGVYAEHWNWETNGVYSPLRGSDGSPEAPFIIRGYPGESAVIDCEEQGHGLWSFDTSYVLFADLEVRRPSASERGGVILGGHDVVAQNVTVRDANWSISQNCTGFLLRGDNSVCHRCRGYDNYDRSEHHWNSSNFLVYADGSDNRVFVIDSYSEGSVTGYKIKHAGTGDVLFHANIGRGSDYGFGGMDDDSVVRFNTFVDNKTAIGMAIADPNAHTRGAMSVHNNTVLRAERGLWVGDGYGGDGGLSVQRNVFVSEAPLGTLDGEALMTFAWPYTTAPDANLLDIDHNCYFAPNDDDGFRLGDAQPAGFAAWQGRGLDTNSVWGDPSFDASAGGGDLRLGEDSPCAAISGVGAW